MDLWEFSGNSLLLRVALLSVWEGIDVCGCVSRQMKEMTELTKWNFILGKVEKTICRRD
jgi:hypothetical protein